MSEAPDEQRAALLEGWEQVAAGWEKRAGPVREFSMPVSAWLLDHLALQPGQRVLELAAGPGDTGFLAAELIEPGGTLISSDGAEAMLEVARARARELGIENVEFRRMELEWIDLPTADVDAIVCRWALMLSVDPGAALRECRRVLRPGGRLAVAVWDEPEHNPWATIPRQPLIELGHAPPPDPDAPGMFALSAPGRLQELLEEAGFIEVLVDTVDVPRVEESVDAYLNETLDVSPVFGGVFDALSEDERAAVVARIAALTEPFTEANGSIRMPGRSLVAAAGA